MPGTDPVFPVLLLMLLSLFGAGVALDHEETRRRARREVSTHLRAWRGMASVRR